MKEIWKYSHTTTVGCKKSKDIKYYYSSEGRLKKVWYNGKIEISTPIKTGNKDRIYITIAKLFPEICGEWYEGCEVDHINTNRFDNRAINLRCVSSKENMNNPLTKQHCSNAAKQRWKDGCYNTENYKDRTYNNIGYLKGHTPWNKGLHYKGKKRSEETKQKMRIAAQNRTKNSIPKGYKFSEEHNKKISLSKIGKHKVWNDETKTSYHYE